MQGNTRWSYRRSYFSEILYSLVFVYWVDEETTAHGIMRQTTWGRSRGGRVEGMKGSGGDEYQPIYDTFNDLK